MSVLAKFLVEIRSGVVFLWPQTFRIVCHCSLFLDLHLLLPLSLSLLMLS